MTSLGRTLSAKGPLGTSSFEMPPSIQFAIEDGKISFRREGEDRRQRALHGMTRAMVANLIKGCSQGFTITLDIVGVGYRANVKGQTVELTLGYSHGISYVLPAGVKADVKEGRLILTSVEKARLGQVAADIRNFRPPEPYKGKGVKYADETILRKEGKARGKK